MKICFCFAKILSNIFQTSTQTAMANIGNVGAIQQVKVFNYFYTFTQAAMGPDNMAMSNIGGMQQVRHSFKYVLTLFSGCNGPPDHKQHGDESVDCVVYTAACSHFEVCKLSGSFFICLY